MRESEVRTATAATPSLIRSAPAITSGRRVDGHRAHGSSAGGRARADGSWSKRSTRIALVAVVLLLIGACAPAGPTTATKTDLVVATAFIPTTLDPMIDGVAASETKLLMDGIFAQTADMKIVPGLATEWKLVNDTTWEFKLRSGVKFHNGDSFTAADVKFNFDRILDPKTQSRQVPTWYPQVASAQVVDDLTLRIVTKIPWPALPHLVQFMRVAPAKYFQAVGAEGFVQKPIGSGPYKFVEWVKDSHLTLEANDSYWAGAPKIKRVTFRYVPDANTRAAQLLSGEVDLVQKLSPTDAAQVKARSGLVVAGTRSMNQMFVGINSFVKPFNDVRVRQAMNYAVNWDEIIAKIMSGFAYRSPSSIGPLTLGFNPNLKPYAYDPARAKQLLAEAGYPNGFETTLDGPVGRYNQDKEVAQAVIADLAKVGIRATYTGAEFQAFFTKFLADAKLPMDKGERGRASALTGLFLLGCNGPADPDLCNSVHFDSKVRGIYYNSPKVDALLVQQRSNTDPQARLLQLQELSKLAQEEAPWIFAYEDASIYGHKAGLKITARPDEFVDVYALSW